MPIAGKRSMISWATGQVYAELCQGWLQRVWRLRDDTSFQVKGRVGGGPHEVTQALTPACTARQVVRQPHRIMS
jgi:hypothetical protein